MNVLFTMEGSHQGKEPGEEKKKRILYKMLSTNMAKLGYNIYMLSTCTK